MKCLRCGSDNVEGSRFCSACGAGLALTCPQCNTVLAPEARFCSGCGAPRVTAPAAATELPAERLQRLIPREYAERLRATRGQSGA